MAKEKTSTCIRTALYKMSLPSSTCTCDPGEMVANVRLWQRQSTRARQCRKWRQKELRGVAGPGWLSLYFRRTYSISELSCRNGVEILVDVLLCPLFSVPGWLLGKPGGPLKLRSVE